MRHWHLATIAFLQSHGKINPFQLTIQNGCCFRTRHSGTIHQTFVAMTQKLEASHPISFSTHHIFIQVPENENESIMAMAKNISKEYALPILKLGDEETDEFTHCLSIASHQLGTTSLSTYAIGIQTLNSIHKDKKIKQRRQIKRIPSQKPVYIDFLPSTMSNLGKRLNKQSNGEMLLKAAGIHKLKDAIIFDLTAGFAQDSMIFASSENVKEVHMVERDPIVGFLLSDAMRRLELISMLDETQCSDIDMELLYRAKILKRKLKLHKMDGKDIGSKLVFSEDSKINIQRPDVCYLDPMFPPRQKSAAVKKNMQILHGLLQSNNVEDDNFRLAEEVDLLDTALALTKSRVVVKRPINAPPLGTLAGVKSDVRLPSYDLKGTINRFDVYIL